MLEYVNLPDPKPGPRQLLIRTAAIGVNYPDIRERIGIYNRAETRVGGQLPQVGGLAVAGTVVAAGPDTTTAVGRRVVALMKKGAYAQLAVADEALCAVVSAVLAVPITRPAPSALAICTARLPTPPAAPCKFVQALGADAAIPKRRKHNDRL